LPRSYANTTLEIGTHSRISAVKQFAVVDSPALRAALPLPAFAFIFFTVILAVNVPVGDDYVVLESVVDLRHAKDGAHFLEVLFSAHVGGEHRLAVTRLLAYAASFLPGGLDLRLLSVLATLALFAALVVAGGMLGLEKHWGYWLLLFLTVLTPQMEKLMFYPMAAVQAFLGLLLGLLYLQFVISDRVLWASVALLAGVFTTGGAVALPVIAAAVLSLRRRWGTLSLHTIIGGTIIAIYFSGDAGPIDGAIEFAFAHPWQTLQLFLGILGSIAEVPAFRYLSWSAYSTVVAGVILLGYSTALLYQACEKHRQATAVEVGTLALVAYSLAMIFLIAVNRMLLYQDAMLAAALDGRYKLYGLLITAVCAINLLRRIQYKRWSAYGAALVLLGAFLMDVDWYFYRANHAYSAAQSRLHAIDVWVRTGSTSELPSWANSPEMAGRALERAADAGIFFPALASR
jgi:hypothetical protein